MDAQKEKIGVIGFSGPQRTQKDILLQREFDRSQDPVKKYVKSTEWTQNWQQDRENFEYRTERDKCMQKQFNPYYNQK